MCSLQAEHFQYMAEPEQMYHHQQQQLHSHRQHMSSRPSLSPEMKFPLKGQGGGGDSGLILSTDAKPRLKWTPELHERFADAVNQLGGPDKATPKAIMRVMGVPGLTLYHLKSHLQKFRLSKNLQAQANSVHAKNVLGFVVAAATDEACEGQGSPADHLNQETQASKSMHISEALQMQIQVQRRLHEQIEVQRHLQLRIEAQGKYLHSVLEKAQEALAKQHVVTGIAAAMAPMPELASSARQRPVQNEGSADGSCLTASEDILSIGFSAAGGDAARRVRGASFETAASASREEGEECYLFLGKPEDRQERREIRRDGCGGGVTFETAAGLDLSIGVVADSRRRPRGERIDLNGSGWN